MTNQSPKVKGVVDIVVMLDATGSMQPCIEALKENVHAFIQSLTEKDANGASPVREWRAKVVGFRDFSADGSDAFQDHLFVDSPEDLREQLRDLKAEGGGDEPESLLEALYKVATLSATGRDEAPQPDSWRYRSDAHRAVIVFSDASFRRELVEPAGATIEDVLNAIESNRLVLTIFAPDVEHYTELATVDKCEFHAVKGGATPQESLEIFSKDRAKFQETLQKLGRTLSQTVAATPL